MIESIINSDPVLVSTQLGWQSAKGQIISKCIFGVFDFLQKTQKINDGSLIRRFQRNSLARGGQILN